MIRILYLITDLEIGGTQKSLYQLVTHLDRNKFDPIVVSLKDEGVLAPVFREAGISVQALYLKGVGGLFSAFKLCKLLKRERIDILHSFLFHANFVGRLCGLAAGTRVIISSVRSLEVEREGAATHLPLERLTRWMPDAVTCVGTTVRDFVRRRAGTPMDKLRVIYNGIPSPQTTPILRQELKLHAGIPIVASASRLAPHKGFEDFLLVAQKIVHQRPDVHFVIIGDGLIRPHLQDLARRLNIEARTHFLGWRKDLASCLADADVFVHPSRLQEGIPMMILEVMALGKPIVATRIGGCPELIEDGKSGFLVNVGDVESMTARVLELLRHRDLAKQLGQATRERFQARFTVDKMVEANVQLYHQLL